jgi:hypothetical protein
MEHLRNLVNHFKAKEIPVPKASEDLFKHIEDTFLPHVLRVLKKDNTLLADVEMFPGIKVPWEGTEEEWNLLNMSILYSVLHGDPKEKFSKILDDEQTKDSFQEILELVMNTRLASLMGDIAQSVRYDDLELDFEDPEKILELLRNPQESIALKTLTERAQEALKERIESGKINQQELIREVEMLRAKFQSAFGKYLNEMVVGDAGGGTTGNTSGQILSNHPEARRARMMARLQKKQKEKARK